MLTLAEIETLTDEQLTQALRIMRAREPFDAARLCYADQLAYIRSPAKRKVLRKTRRAGGTVGLATALLEDALKPPFANQLYVTSTLKNARRLVWPTLKKLNDKHACGGIANETEAFMRFPKLPNEPIIYLGGAKDREEIDKIRGLEGGLKRAAVDEVQAIRLSIMQSLVDDVIEPSLFDYDGRLELVGTPGPVCAGYFYDADKGANASAWEHFFLDMRRNPFLQKKSGKTATQILAELLARRKWQPDNPTFLREYCGEWVTDSGALALHYDSVRNRCEWMDAPVRGWRYIIVFDIGFDDADAIAVLGWAPNERKLRLVKEVITRKQGITPLGDQLKMLFGIYQPMHLVGDLGALGKKIGEELTQRWGLPVEAADKSRKAEHVALLDDALRTGHMLAPPDSRFAEDCAIVQWDADKKAKGVLEFDSAYHTDIGDAVLYGFRRAYHWIEDETPVEPTPFDDPLLKAMLATQVVDDAPNYD
jgi:hypothetical protein